MVVAMLGLACLCVFALPFALDKIVYKPDYSKQARFLQGQMFQEDFVEEEIDELVVALKVNQHPWFH